MSKSHSLEHLTYTLYRRSSHSPLSLSSLSFFNSKSLHRINFVSSLFSRIRTSFSFPYCTSLAAPLDSCPTTPSSAYLSVRIRCPKHVSDMLSEALLCFGASSVGLDEQDDSDSSNEICIDSIFPECQNVDMYLAQAADAIGLKKIPAYEVKVGEQYDWIRKTQESFHPVEVTEGLWIVPKWSSPPDPGATHIILDPGLAFGTGEHPTTKLCLLLLHPLIKGGELFLDYGTGSGILGIAAIKFGGSLSIGVDVDPQAISSARHNIALNYIKPERMELVIVPSNPSSLSGNKSTDTVVEDPSSDAIKLVSKRGKCDVVIANILLNPLLELADEIVSYARPGAVVGLSGILSEQVPYIMDRYSVLLEDVLVSEMDGWACISGRKKNNLDKK